VTATRTVRPWRLHPTTGALTAAADATVAAPEWVDTVGDVGAASLFVPDEDPLLTVLGQDGLDLLQFLVDDVPAFVCWPDPARRQRRTIDGALHRGWVFSGPGLLGILDKLRVYPTSGVERQPKETTRFYNWTYPLYDISGLPNAQNMLFTNFAKTTWPWPWASDFPADGIFGPFSGTQNLWADNPGGNPSTYLNADAGHCWFFYDEAAFYVDGYYRFSLAADDSAELYLDGQQLLTTDTFTQTRTVDVKVTAGTHRLAVHARNGDDLSVILGWSGPGAISVAIQYVSLVDATLVGFSTDAWQVVAYEDEPPGVTPGQALLWSIDEGTVRGVLPGLTFSFDTDLDSNGNPWDEVGDIAVPVGTSGVDFARQLNATYTDLAMSVDLEGDGLLLHAYRRGERGGASGLTLTETTSPETTNVVEVVHQRENYPATVLLAESTDLWYEFEGDTATYGRNEARIDIGAPASFQEIERIALAALADYGVTREQIDVELEPIDAGEVPYAGGWQVGDTVDDVVDSVGVAATERCHTIACVNGPNERTEWTLSFRDVVYDALERTVTMVLGNQEGDR
jgi:hypothetical protein